MTVMEAMDWEGTSNTQSLDHGEKRDCQKRRRRRVSWQRTLEERSSEGQGEEAPEGRAGNPFKDPLELWVQGSQPILTKLQSKGMDGQMPVALSGGM